MKLELLVHLAVLLFALLFLLMLLAVCIWTLKEMFKKREAGVFFRVSLNDENLETSITMSTSQHDWDS